MKTTLLRTDRSRQKVRKDLKELNETGNTVDPIDIYRTLHAVTAEYTLFSRTRGTLTVIKHILSHKIIHNHLKEQSYRVCSLNIIKIKLEPTQK